MNRCIEALVWAMNSELPPAPWKVLVCLARRVGKKGFYVWPSHGKLAKDTGISVSYVRKILGELVDQGYLKVFSNFDERGDRIANSYQLQVRVRFVEGGGNSLEIEPEDDDDDVADVPPDLSKIRTGPPATIGAPPLPTGGHTPCPPGGRHRTIQEEHIPEELHPSLPSEEHSLVDLLGDEIVVRPISTDLVDYVAAEWKKLAEEFPRIPNPRVLNDARKKKIRARANEVASQSAGRLTLHDVWDQIFAAIRGSSFLRGDSEPSRGYRDPFAISIDKILEPARFLQTLERAMIDAERNQHTHSAGGRRYGPAEQAMREIIASMGSCGE